jgi:hypothetical protein
MEDHTHGEDGHVLVAEEPESDAEAMADASVKIAEIQAETEVAVARIEAKAEEKHDLTEIEVLRAEVAAMRAMMTPPEPEADPEPDAEPAPEPVVIQDEQEEDEDAPPESEHHDVPAKHKVGLGMW